MNPVFMDTSAYSAFRRGHTEVMNAIKCADRLLMNPIVLAELYAGFEFGKYKRQNNNELKEFLESDTVLINPITKETAERYLFI